jgi:hypothetical protein
MLYKTVHITGLFRYAIVPGSVRGVASLQQDVVQQPRAGTEPTGQETSNVKMNEWVHDHCMSRMMLRRRRNERGAWAGV